MTENEKLIKRVENYRDGHCVVQLDALLAEGGNPLVYKGRIDSCNQIIAALRRTAEDDKAREEGRLVVVPCKQYTTVYYLLDKRVFVGWYLAQVGETTHLILQDRIEMGICWVTDGAWFLTRQEAEAALGGGEGG